MSSRAFCAVGAQPAVVHSDPIADGVRDSAMTVAIALEIPATNPLATPDELLREAVRALQQALEARDPYTRNHSRRVADYAAAIAHELGMDRGTQQEIRLAGELHDVGKIGVADDLLKRRGPLTQDEYHLVLQHTLIGERILRPLFRDRPTILRVARCHHERFDGRGFPDGLHGEDIPLAARIVAIADSFDAMTSARPYRGALPIRVAAEELARGAGTQFDPDCVAAMLAVVSRKWRARTGSQRPRRSGVRRWAGVSRSDARPWVMYVRRISCAVCRSRSPPTHLRWRTRGS